jgi:hypothetical protein
MGFIEAAPGPAALDAARQPRAALTVRTGFPTLRRVAEFFGIEHASDPAPDDPISIDRAEFDAACERLAEQGVPLKPDRDQAWRDLTGWRVDYDTVLLGPAEITMAPHAPRTSDRSTPRHRQARLRRWGRRRAGVITQPSSVRR